MKISIDDKALHWFERELDLHPGDSVRIFARYGGEATVHPGFSLGIQVDQPTQVAVSAILDGILFYIRDQDLWYFDDRDLRISYRRDEDTVTYAVGSSVGVNAPYLDA